MTQEMKDFNQELVGRKVIGSKWDGSKYPGVGWSSYMADDIGKEGTILEYDSFDNTFYVDFPRAPYWVPAPVAVKNIVKEADPLSEVKVIAASLAGIDGEKMQLVLEEIGMDIQMLRQLIMSAPAGLVEQLLEEKNNL